jgi:L-alanine-DL-glutamate epimerase-like enolase superfamily enzyme
MPASGSSMSRASVIPVSQECACYASTYLGDHEPGGLSNPEVYVDFAEQCLEMGYPAYNIHGWQSGPLKSQIAVVHTVGKRVSGKMDLMLDSFHSR